MLVNTNKVVHCLFMFTVYSPYFNVFLSFMYNSSMSETFRLWFSKWPLNDKSSFALFYA